MSPEETTSLQRLLRPREVGALLESFARLAPDLGVAVIRTDGKPLSNAGSWPQESLQEMLVSVGGDGASVRPPSSELSSARGCRYYPLFAGEQPVGTLAARGEPSDTHAGIERVLHQTLSALLARSLENRAVAAEALQGYREVNLLYRVGETIGRRRARAGDLCPTVSRGARGGTDIRSLELGQHGLRAVRAGG